jgi:hypothetical protein
MVFAFLTVFLLVIPVPASADGPESCPTRGIEAKKIVAESPNFSLSLARLPTKDQKRTSTCYAYVASDLADYYLKNSEELGPQSGLEPEVHPLWVAYIETKLEADRTKNEEDVLLGRGSLTQSLNQLRQMGNCSYAYIESELKKNKIEATDLVRLIDRLLETTRSEAEENEERRRVRGVARQLCEQDSIPLSRQAERRVGAGRLDQFSFEIAIRNFIPKCFSDDAYLSHERMKKLPPHRTFARSRAPGEYERDARARVAKAIELGWPTAIAHCSKFYNAVDEDERVSGPFYNSAGKRLVEPAKCGAHSASIIGEAWVGGKCQYLVRQSSGNGRTPDRACRCWDKGRTRHDFCSKFEKDERGDLLGCYLGQDELIGASSSITYVVDSKVRAALESAPK